jgi:hypothetical protein
MAVAAMVSGAVAPPVVKAPAATTEVTQVADTAERRSEIDTPVLRAPLMVVPGAPLPMLAVAGTVIVSAPDVTVNVVVVEHVVEAAQVPAWAGPTSTPSSSAVTPTTRQPIRLYTIPPFVASQPIKD